MTGPLITARDVADIIGVSVETILRWTRAGKLPAIRTPGGALRYDPAAIDETLAAWSTGAGRAAPGGVASPVSERAAAGDRVNGPGGVAWR